MKFQFLGATRQVTGSQHLLQVGGTRILVDCGLFQERDFQARNFEPSPFSAKDIDALLLTHAHLDHVEGVPALRAFSPDVPIYLHPDDQRLYEGVDTQARAFNLPLVGELPPPDRSMAHGQLLTFGGVEFLVRHAPGHAPGHVIFILEKEGLAFVGDVIFQGGIGRADLVGGSFPQLMESIRTQVMSLPDDMRLLTGHGPETTVGWERRTNPFLVGHFGGDLA